MIEFLFWGVITIIGAAITLIVIVLGVYYILTKGKKRQEKPASYKLEDQKEIV